MAATLPTPQPEILSTGSHNAFPDIPVFKQTKSKKGKAKASVFAMEQKPAVPGSDVGSKYTMREETWSWSTISGAYSNQRAPVFTKDGSYFFAIVGTSVKIYSSVSGKVISTLSSSTSSGSASRESSGTGHSENITAALVNPENPFQLITASLDGTIKIWDFMDAVLLQTLVVGEPILHMCAHEKCKGYVFIATLTKDRPTSITKPGSGNSLIYRISLSPAKKMARQARPSQLIKVGKTKSAGSLSISASGNWLIVIGGHYVYVTRTSSTSAFTKYDSPERLTALIAHPNEDYFATGDAIGQIRLWYCLSDEDGSNQSTRNSSYKSQTTAMHWHAHAVSSLAFTPNGSYLISGGEESVLVIWQLHSGKREFVPRVGAPIACIAVRSTRVGEEEYLLGLVDGSFVFVDSTTLSVARSIIRVKLSSSKSFRRHSSVPLGVHRQTSSIIIPSSHPSSLQVYSPSTSSLLLELEVSPSNRISRRDEKYIEPARVECVAISDCGGWMATIDRLVSDNNFETEVYLKFWKWEGGTWVLNSRIDKPHGHHAISTIFFSPRPLPQSYILLMTTGLDGTVKTWGILPSQNKNGGVDEIWVKRSAFSFRQEIPKHAAISADSTLLAIIFGETVILHDSASGRLIESICSSQIRAAEQVQFVGRNSRFLLIKCHRELILWDIVKRVVKWRYRSSNLFSRVLVQGAGDKFTVFSNVFTSEDEQYTTRVLVFSPASPQPLEDHIVPYRFRTVASYPKDQSGSFVGITSQGDIIFFGDKITQKVDNVPTFQSIPAPSESPSSGRTLFQDIFGKSALVDTAVPHSESLAAPTTSSLNTIPNFASTPAYLAPPVATLYASLMSNFLTKAVEDVKKQDLDDEETSQVMEVDAQESNDSPERIRKTTPHEINALTDLFCRHEFISSSSKSKPNGFVNNVNHTKVNGVHSRSPAKPVSTGLTAPSQSVSSDLPSPQPASPVTVGKKRKKTVQE